MITLDENGKQIDLLAERNEEIKAKLQPILDDFLKEKDDMMILKKPVNLGYRFTKQLHYVLSTYGQMSAEAVARLDCETIQDFWLKYLELTAWCNRFFEVVDNKQLFMAFAGLNNRIYMQLEKSDDEDIRNLMQSINDSFIGLGFSASESGNASPSAIKQRLGAKNVGHSVVSASEELIADKLAQQSTPRDIIREVEKITGNKVNLLGEKK